MSKPSDFQTYSDFKRTLKKNKTLSLLIAVPVAVQDLLGKKQKTEVV